MTKTEELEALNLEPPKEFKMKFVSLKSFIMITIAAASLLFIYVAVITEIKNMNKDKINKIEKLNDKLNQIELANVEVQRLTAEERIVKIAQDSLGLVRPEENFEVLQVSKDQIKQIEKFVNEKYD